VNDSEHDRLAPVVKVVTVPGEPGFVFELFTARLGEWWPLESHSVEGANAADARVEPGVGGRVYEMSKDGVEHDWARILEWEEPNRLAMDWYPGIPAAQSTHLEITFRQTAEGTEVTLIHDGWEARGADAKKMWQNYQTGWDLVLRRIPGSALIEATA
jgi:hypothetical protein